MTIGARRVSAAKVHSAPDPPRRITRSQCAAIDLVEAGDFTIKRRKKHKTFDSTIRQGSSQGHRDVTSTETEAASTTSPRLDYVKESIEFGEEPDEDEEFDEVLLSDDEETELEAFYRKVGYLPPLDDATLDALKLFYGMDKEADKEKATAGRISPNDQQIFRFEDGLECRNVAIEADPDDGSDRFVLEKLQDYSSASGQQDPEDVTKYLKELWGGDLQKCKAQSQEAVFQRLAMISMIDRHNTIYRRGNESEPSLFDFAVEAQWTCPPMPTKAKKLVEAGDEDTKWLTCPLPDLAVAFCRTSLQVPDGFDWTTLPKATKKLICYEGELPEKNLRAFHFLTIEAKRFYKDVDDRVARAQCLNNASQALHNLYEIFREADQEMESCATKIFFDEIRFFSVVATPKGIKIRVHRAQKINKNDRCVPIAPDYPLRFSYIDYCEITGKEYTYDHVTEKLSSIILGYGAKVMKSHLEKALAAIHRKFAAYEDQRGMFLPRDNFYYSHGHVPLNAGRKSTTASTKPGSRSSKSLVGGNRSDTRDGSTTPRPQSGLRSPGLNIGGLNFSSRAPQGEGALSAGPLRPATIPKSWQGGAKRQRID